MLPETWVRQIEPEEVLPLRSRVLRPHHPLIDCVFDGDRAPMTAHFGAGLEGGEILAVGTIYREPMPADLACAIDSRGFQVWRLRGMATSEEARGQGLGARVLEACIDYVSKSKTPQSDALIWAHARTPALEFYRRHGFRTMGGEYTLPGVGPHYAIVREVAR